LASWSDKNKETNKTEITARFLFHFCQASVHEMLVRKVLPLVPVSMFQCSLSHLLVCIEHDTEQEGALRGMEVTFGYFDRTREQVPSWQPIHCFSLSKF